MKREGECHEVPTCFTPLALTPYNSAANHWMTAVLPPGHSNLESSSPLESAKDTCTTGQHQHPFEAGTRAQPHRPTEKIPHSVLHLPPLQPPSPPFDIQSSSVSDELEPLDSWCTGDRRIRFFFPPRPDPPRFSPRPPCRCLGKRNGIRSRRNRVAGLHCPSSPRMPRNVMVSLVLARPRHPHGTHSSTCPCLVSHSAGRGARPPRPC